MNKPWTSNSHNIHHNPNLGEITILISLTYFAIGGKDCIEMSKKLKISKRVSLILSSYESLQVRNFHIHTHTNYNQRALKRNDLVLEEGFSMLYYMLQLDII